MRQRLRALAIAAAIASCIAAHPAAAQPQVGPPAPPAAQPVPAPAPTPPAPPPGPAAIPLVDIAPRIESASRAIAEIEAVLEPPASVAAIETAIREKGPALDFEVRSAAEMVQAEISLEQIDELAGRAGNAARRLDEIQKLLSQRSQLLDGKRAEIAMLRETWTLTLEAARKDGAPAELIESIKSVRTQLRDLDRKLDERFDATLKMQSRVGEESLAVGVLVQDLRRARYEASGRIFERNRKPLPLAFVEVESAEPLLKRVTDGLERDADNVRNFARLQKERLTRHALLLAFALGVAFWMRGWVAKRRHDGKRLGASEPVFDHPISAALLVTVLASPMLYEYMPRSFAGLLGLVTVVPVLVLVPNVLAPSHKAVWYTVAALYVVGRVRYALQPAELIERSIFTLEVGAAIGLVVHLLRTGAWKQLVGPRWQRVSGLALRGATFVLTVALVAELAGFEALAKLLGEGVLGAAYAGVVLYAAVNVLRPIVAALLRSQLARRLAMVQTRRDAIESAAGRVIAWIAGLWWSLRVLEGFSLREPVTETVSAFVTEKIPLGDVAFSLGDVLIFVATAASAVALSRLARAALEEDVFPRTPLARGVPHAISATVRYLILIAGFLLAAAAAGFEWNRVTLLAGAFGVGIGFGLQNIVNNFVSGLILLYERPIQVGDTVEVGALMGEVRRIGIRSSTVRTWQGAEVIVPNANLIAEQVVNWTLSDHQRRVDLPIGVEYGAEPEQVLSMLEQIGAQHPDVLSQPPPIAIFQGFGDSSLNFELRVWTVSIDRILRLRTELGIAVFRALQKQGIGIPFPQRDVRVTIAKEDAG